MTKVTVVGGPTALIEYAGLRWLTDPTFSAPGEYGGLVKTSFPAIGPDQLGQIDAVLLSHDHHAGNLDPAGREFLPRAAQVLTTVAGAERLGPNASGLEPWAETEVAGVTVTAVPALHGPPGAEPVTGPVIGFILSSEGQDTVYVSGDNASVDVVDEIAARLAPIDVAILFVGAVQIATRFDGAYLALSGDRAAIATELLEARAVVPVHFEGWTHLTQGLDAVRAAFAGYGLSDRLRAAQPGATVDV